MSLDAPQGHIGFTLNGSEITVRAQVGGQHESGFTYNAYYEGCTYVMQEDYNTAVKGAEGVEGPSQILARVVAFSRDLVGFRYEDWILRTQARFPL